MATEPIRSVPGSAPGAARYPETDHRPRFSAEDHGASDEQVQDEVIEELRHHSPEGSPPHRAERRISVGVLIIIAVLVLFVVMGVVTALGGWEAGLVAAGFVLVAYLLAGAPILYAMMFRLREETVTRDIVTGQDGRPREPRI